MSDLVPVEDIERIVGTKRHRNHHQARAVSAEQTVYILHSQECLDSGVDLRECRYSLALDNGIREEEWPEDLAVVVKVAGAFGDTRLAPQRCTYGRFDTEERARDFAANRSMMFHNRNPRVEPEEIGRRIDWICTADWSL